MAASPPPQGDRHAQRRRQGADRDRGARQLGERSGEDCQPDAACDELAHEREIVALEPDPLLDAGAVERLVDDAPDRRAVLERDQGLTRQGCRSQWAAALAGELVLRAHDHGELFARELELLEVVRRRGSEREREVEASVAEHVDHPLGGAFPEAYLDIGILGGEAREDRGDVELAAEQQRSDRDPAAHETAELVDVITNRVRLGEDGARPRCHELAGAGRLDGTRRPAQQLDPEFPLEPADLVRERRLGHVQLLRGAGEVPVASDGLEVAEVADVHSAPAVYL
jgi:hypothetical protein